jgi:Spy/CpxP family protein refolding chaperone
MKRSCTGLVLVLTVVLAITGLGAQQPQQPDDPIGRHLFPPDLLMKYQREIGLSESQRNTMLLAITKSQTRFLELQFESHGESEKLAQLLQARPVDEAAVLAQADRLMALERDVKKTHLSLLVRLKNLLSESQQRKLGELPR